MVHRRRLASAPTASLMAVLTTGTLLCPRAAFALDPSLDISQYAHTAWKSRDGVVRGAVGSIAQTPDGYLWVGTDQGLLRFDGVRTVPFLPGEQLPSDALNRLLVGRDGALWIGTDKGLVRWKDGKFERFPQVVASSVYPLVEDRAGTLWIGTDGPAGVCAARGGRVGCERDERLGRSGIEALEDGSGKLWFGTRTGVWRWLPGPPERFPLPTGIYDAKGLVEDGNGGLLLATNGGVKRFVDGKIESQPGLEAARRPLTFLRSRDGSLWIGGFNGLSHLHHGRVDVFGREDGLSGQVVNRLYEDREGSVWVGTSSGLDRFREFTFPTLSPDQGLSSSLTWAVQASRDGSVWIAASNGLNRWQDGRVTFYGTRPPSPPGRRSEGVQTVPLLESPVRSMALDDQDRLWVGLKQGIFRIEGERLVQIPGLPGEQVLAIATAGHDEIWVSVAERGLFHWTATDPVQNFSWAFFGGKDSGSAALLPDPARHGVWIGFRDGGVARLEDGRVAGRWGTAEGLGAGHVNHLRFGDRGAVWAATEGGLSRIADGKVRTLTTRQGLPCDAVSWSIEDDDHATWLYTGCGLLHVTRSELDAWVEDPARTLRTTVFDGSDGVMKVGTYAGYFGPAVARAPDGKIWFTHDDGVTRIDPRNLPHNSLPPPVHIEQVTADGTVHDAAAGPLRLPPHVRDLSIDYTALSLVAPEKVRFRVKLEGQDKDWRELVNDRHVRYTNLPPRSYRFRVKASNDSGVWTDQDASLDFAIPPAWYQAAWFRMLCVAALASLLWAAHRVRLRILMRHQRLLERHQTEITALNERLMKAQEEASSRIAGELHDGVLQQLTTVTLDLGTVKYQVPTGSAAKDNIATVQNKLISLGADIRQLSHDLHPAVLQESGLPQALSTYCEEFIKTRGIPASCDADPELKNLSRGSALALYRIAQEALGNAAKHARATRVNLRLERAGEMARLTVSDDGAGFLPGEVGARGGVGLVSMRERVRQLRGALDIESHPGHGTTVRAEVPFHSA